MKTFIFTFFLSLLSLVGIAQVQTADTDFRAKIIKMLNLQGSQKQFEIAIDQMIDIQLTYNGEATDEFWEKFRSEIKGEGLNKLYDMLVPIYQKHLTEQEVDAIIAFYETPEGRALVGKTPFIMQESMQAGAIWGEEIGKRIVEEMGLLESDYPLDSLEVIPPPKNK